MARRSAIEKGKEVEKMKRVAALLVMLAAGLVLAPVHRIEASPGVPVIVALGDSLTAGLGLPQDQAFPAQLEAALKARGTEAKVVDAGVSGDTAAATLARLDWALPDDADAVIIELGGNDALQGIPPEGTKAALAKIIERVQARGLPILLAGQEAPRNMGKDYVDQFRAIFADLASRYDVIFYPFFLEGAALNDELMQADGMHPNAKGVAAIVENIMPKVDELLAQVAAKDQAAPRSPSR
jgi:acyl-CoA thioesterase I